MLRPGGSLPVRAIFLTSAYRAEIVFGEPI